MSNNNATVLGLNAFNAAKQKDVENRAANLIAQILSNQRTVKGYEKNITEEQVKLNELALDVVDQTTVIGAEFSTPLNPNQQTILNAIKKLNDARQETVSLQSQAHINRIKGYQDTIKNLNTQISEWRKQLAELAVDVTTIANITGSAE